MKQNKWNEGQNALFKLICSQQKMIFASKQRYHYWSNHFLYTHSSCLRPHASGQLPFPGFLIFPIAMLHFIFLKYTFHPSSFSYNEKKKKINSHILTRLPNGQKKKKNDENKATWRWKTYRKNATRRVEAFSNFSSHLHVLIHQINRNCGQMWHIFFQNWWPHFFVSFHFFEQILRHPLAVCSVLSWFELLSAMVIT